MVDFTAAKDECDVVMKGGITSGVVYPLTVVKLAERYRFKNIGGTSAGALAAAITAAAEYNRKGGGFEKIGDIPREVASKLQTFFQPAPSMKPVFDLLLAAQDKQVGPWGLAGRAAWILLSGYWGATLVGLVPGALLAALLWTRLGPVEVCLVLVACLVGLLASLGYRLYRVATIDLPANDFGLCSGETMPGSENPGLTDWLADTIDDVAGIGTAGEPLVFKQLWGEGEAEPDIRLDMMTTNLSMQRAHRLPLRQNIYAFRRSEFERLFPNRVVAYMVRVGAATEDPDLFWLPEGNLLPVVVAARMSLSFPGLISAVPLYARDLTLKAPKDKAMLRRCLFSDGGLTSNFPIHFFDRFLPSAPTFGISLESWREAQHDKKAYFPEDPPFDPAVAPEDEEVPMPVRDIPSFGSFLMALIDSAKGWQDNLQSTLPGYRERIVHIALDDSREGGLNLTMDKHTIDTLVDRGGEAAKEILTGFNFDEHRWRRFLVAARRLEESLDQMAEVYQPQQGVPFRRFVETYRDKADIRYQPDEAWLREALDRFDLLMAAARKWKSPALFTEPGVKIPRPDSDLRITARY